MDKVKITELKETRFRTVTKKDALGNRTRVKEEYTAYREVQTVATGPRFGHFIIDSICFQVIVAVFQLMVSLTSAAMGGDGVMGATSEFLLQISGLLMYPLLYFACESAWGKTPGKFLTRCVVINEYGERPDARTLALRSLLRLVPFEALSCFGGNNSYGWHDKWSHTWVVKEEELALIKSLQAAQSFEV